MIEIDGKTVRRARHAGRAAPHLVAALTHRLVIRQTAVDAKFNEIPALRDLLARLRL